MIWCSRIRVAAGRPPADSWPGEGHGADIAEDTRADAALADTTLADTALANTAQVGTAQADVARAGIVAPAGTEVLVVAPADTAPADIGRAVEVDTLLYTGMNGRMTEHILAVLKPDTTSNAPLRLTGTWRCTEHGSWYACVTPRILRMPAFYYREKERPR